MKNKKLSLLTLLGLLVAFVIAANVLKVLVALSVILIECVTIMGIAVALFLFVRSKLRHKKQPPTRIDL